MAFLRLAGQLEKDIIHAHLGDIDLIEGRAGSGQRLDDLGDTAEVAQRCGQFLAAALRLAGGKGRYRISRRLFSEHIADLDHQSRVADAGFQFGRRAFPLRPCHGR